MERCSKECSGNIAPRVESGSDMVEERVRRGRREEEQKGSKKRAKKKEKERKKEKQNFLWYFFHLLLFLFSHFLGLMATIEEYVSGKKEWNDPRNLMFVNFFNTKEKVISLGGSSREWCA